MVKTKLIVKGMMCENCEVAVIEAVIKKLQVESAQANNQNDTVILESNENLDEDEIRKVIEELGYQLEGVEIL